MGLLAEIAAHAPAKGPGCSMVDIESQLNKPDLADLRTAYANAAVTHMAIFRALKARGLPVKESAVARHRKGECSCERPA